MSDNNLFTGHGEPTPKPRVLNAGFFGTVDDAFASRSLHLPTRAHLQQEILVEDAENLTSQTEEATERQSESDARDLDVGRLHCMRGVKACGMNDMSVSHAVSFASPFSQSSTFSERKVLISNTVTGGDRC